MPHLEYIWFFGIGRAVVLSGICDASLAYGVTSGTTYTPTLDSSLYSNGIYTDLIDQELDTLGESAGAGTYSTWADFMEATGAYDSWTDYKSAVATLLGTSVSSGYTVVSGVTLNDSIYYTTFTVYSVGSDGTVTSENYGVLLNDNYGTTTTAVSAQEIISSYLTKYSSGNGTTIDTTDSTYSFTYIEKGSDVTISYGATNTNAAITSTTTSTGGITTVDSSDRLAFTTTTTTGTTVTISGNFVRNASSNANGGAISALSQDSGTGTQISFDSITGDFIGNKANSTSTTLTYQGNGGAISLFAKYENDSNYIGAISGDFIGNSATRAGGAIYLFSNNNATVYIKSIESDFVGNSALGGSGGAIANYEGTIGTIKGNFIGNIADDYGGGISNYISSSQGGRLSSITSITSDFIGNSASDGGAIANYVYTYTTSTGADNYSSVIIGDIVGDFISNSATGDGGAIYNYAHSLVTNTEVSNTAIISTITGDFIGNSAGGSGGAIYNDDSSASTALIGIITGDFICNTAGLYGGAIYNTSQITALNSSFIQNTATSTDAAIGGAIYNKANGESASIGDITGSFIGNSATATAGLGGAIANYSAVAGKTATIGTITGDFMYNTASKYGGAIYNDSNEVGTVTIGAINGNFLYNGVIALVSTEKNVKGGAIYNNDTIGAIEGSFIGNYVIGATDNDVNGGAIYTTANMTFTATNQTNYFSDNYTAYYDDSNGEYIAGTTTLTGLDYNAIYVDVDTITDNAANSDIHLNFTMAGTGSFVVNDSISGNTSYTALSTISTFTNASADFKESTRTLEISYVNTTTDSSNTTATSASITGTVETKYTVVNTVTDPTTTTSNTDGGITTTTETTVTTTITTTYDTSKNTGTTTTAVTTVTNTNGNITEDTTTTTVDNSTTTAPTYTTGTTTTTTTYTITSGDDTATYKTVVSSTDGSTTSTTKTASISIASTDSEGNAITATYTYVDANGTTSVTEGLTTAMTGTTAFDMTITGVSKDQNTFYLNDEITNFGDFSISNGTLYLNSYTHTDGTVTKGSLTALDSSSSVTFGSGSQLTIDMSAYTTSVGTETALSSTAVLTGNGASLNINDLSSLKLANATTGNTYTILKGFTVDDIQGEYAWSSTNVSVDSSLQKAVIVRDGYNDTLTTVVDSSTAVTSYDATAPVYYAISVIADAASSPLATSSVNEIVINAADSASFGPSSSNAGERYVYDVSTISNISDQVPVLEGTASLAKIAGVSTTGYNLNRVGSDAISSRMSNIANTDGVLVSYDSGASDSAEWASGSGANEEGIGKLSKKYDSVALWFVPMYSHDLVDGAHIAGYEAGFCTNVYGGVAGFDKTIKDDGANALGADLYRVGLAVNMGVGDTTTRGDFKGITNDFNFGGVFAYAVAEYGDLTLSADAGFTKIFSELNQDLSAYGFAGAHADVQSSVWSVDLQGQYRIDMSSVNIVPYAGIAFSSMKTEDYSINRSDAAGGTIFTVSSDRQNIISAPVGVKLDKQMSMENGWKVTPQLSLGAIFAMGDLDEDSVITMPGVAGSGRTSMEVVDAITFDMSVGAAFSKDNWQIGLDYELQMSQNRTGHALVGLVQYRF